MCIRDSTEDERFFYAFIPNLCRQNKLYFTFWEEKIMMNVKKYQKPVSYTHLDVYKRQILGIAFIQNIYGNSGMAPLMRCV